ncbi:VWA domain-containing protein [Sesbania bispinosa]|nr:VWA domain-containing protein [Sesbania bispinosa]
MGEKDLGGFADEVAAGERVASNVVGKWRWWGNLRRQRPSGRGGGCDLSSVLRAEVAPEM